MQRQLLRHWVQSVRRVAHACFRADDTAVTCTSHKPCQNGCRWEAAISSWYTCVSHRRDFQATMKEWGSNERSVRELSKGEQFYQLYSYSNYDPAPSVLYRRVLLRAQVALTRPVTWDPPPPDPVQCPKCSGPLVCSGCSPSRVAESRYTDRPAHRL